MSYRIVTRFRKSNRLLVISFLNGYIDPAKDSYDTYHKPLFGIKDFKALIHNKHFLINPWKTNKDNLKNREMFRNVKKRWLYNKKLIRLFVLSKIFKTSFVLIYRDKTSTSIRQQIDFTGKLEDNDSEKLFFIGENW